MEQIIQYFLGNWKDVALFKSVNIQQLQAIDACIVSKTVKECGKKSLV